MKSLLLLTLAACLGLAGCDRAEASAPATASTPAAARPVVLATTSILADLAAQVAGPDATVTTLVGPDGDPHNFEPTPRSSVTLHGATLLLEVGLGFETWADKLYEASGSEARRVVVTDGLSPLHAGHGDEMGGQAAVCTVCASCGSGEADPHVWHDPGNASAMIERIAGALIAADPAAADGYAARRDAAIARFDELDAWVGEQVARIPPERRILATTHDALGHFAGRYGFREINLLGSVSTAAADPTAARTAAVIDEIRAAGVPAVFAENIGNPKMTRLVAEQAGVEVVGSLYTCALGQPGTPGDTLDGMIRHNVTAIVEALR